MRVFLFLSLISLSVLVLAQDAPYPQSHLPTENVRMGKDANKRSNRPKQKRYSYIYVPNGDKVLYGNPCALEQTHKMGFEYLVEPKGDGSKTSKGKLLNNLWVKSKLVVLRTPFWKVILKKRFRDCRAKSGDFVG
ncbi:MAG: hypothetical protein AB8B73_00455 [Ekhidna sp.]